MSRILALKLQPNSALVAIVRGGGEAIVVESAARVSWSSGDDAAARGRAIAEAVEKLRPGKTPSILVIPRADLSIQTYDLPPAPADDLPDLVHMQAQRDLPIADDGEGFDFLPLAGDEEHPHRVMCAGLLPPQWKALRETCDAAGLKPERIVPEPLGWAEFGRRVTASGEGATDALTAFATIMERQAVVWAAEGDTLRLIRSLWLHEDEDAAADAAALGGELRRTLLSLAQSPSGQRGPIKCVYVGENADEISGELGATISKPVQAAPLERLVTLGEGVSNVSLIELAPMAALAAAAAERRPAPIDLLHPRRRPPPPSRMRTYLLAGVAAALVAAFVAWKGYRDLQSPLEAANAARAETESLKPVLERLATDEAKAAAVRRWLDDSVNLLTEVDSLGEKLRPLPLDSEEFKADQDLVLTKLVVSNRQLTLDAVAHGNGAILPAENRLRAADYRVDRGAVDTNSQTVPGYTVSVTDTVQHAEPPAAGGSP